MADRTAPPPTEAAAAARVVEAAQLRRLLRSWVAPILILAAAFWFVASPILDSPYWGDDMANAQLPMAFALDETPAVDFIVTQTRNWTRDTGRFFPLSVVQSTVVFTTFTDRASYKAYQFAFVGLTLVLAALLFGVALRSRWAGFVVFGLTLPAVQMRSWYDPFWQFHGLQELVASAAILSSLCAIIAARCASRWAFAVWAGLAILFLFVAVLTYESSVFLVGVTLILLLRERAALRRRIAVGGAVAVAGGLILANLLYWRSQAVVTNPGYIISLAPRTLITTLLEQMLAAVPLSYGLLTRPTLLPENPSLPAPVAITALVAVAYAIVIAAGVRILGRTRPRGMTLLALAAVAFWVVPSLFVAISSRWQAEVTLGLGYIPVLFGAIAVGWLAMLAVAFASERLQTSFRRSRQGARAARIAIAGASGTIGLAAAAVLVIIGVSNYAAVRFPPFTELQAQRDDYAAAVQEGLYADVPPTATIVRPVPDWWYWVNTPFTAWYGGPASIRFATPDEAAVGACGDSACLDLVEARTADGRYTYSLRPR